MAAGEGESTNEVRLAELIWRTIKIRLFLLAVTLATILVTWSAIEAGYQKAVQIDAEFKQQTIESLKTLGVNTKPVQDYSGSNFAQLFSEMERRLYELIVPSIGTGEDSRKGRQYLDSRLNQLDEYDQKRRDAFRIEIYLPYLRQTVSVNALTLADIWPFCALAMAMLILTLGFQKKNYEVILSTLVSGRKTERERSTWVALTGFFPGTITRAKHKEQPIFLYKRPFILFPESFVVGSLLVVSVILSLGLLGAYDPTFRHPTDSIVLSYYSLTWSIIVVATILLKATHSYYQQRLNEVVGAPVRNARLFRLTRTWGNMIKHHHANPLQVRRLGGVITTILVAIGLASLLLPWVVPRSLAGYTFLLGQKPLNSVRGPNSIALFPIDPAVFFEMKLHVLIAVAFLVLCLCQSIVVFSGITRPRRVLEAARLWLGYLILFLAGNLLFHLGVLQYESGTKNPGPVIDLILSRRGITAPRGLPLLFYNPTYGFWIFTACCVLLAIMTPRMRASRQRVDPSNATL